MSGQANGQSAAIGTLLDNEIARRRMSNEEVAHELGVSERMVRRWRKGQMEPSRKHRDSVFMWLAGLDPASKEAA